MSTLFCPSLVHSPNPRATALDFILDGHSNSIRWEECRLIWDSSSLVSDRDGREDQVSLTAFIRVQFGFWAVEANGYRSRSLRLAYRDRSLLIPSNHLPSNFATSLTCQCNLATSYTLLMRERIR